MPNQDLKTEMMQEPAGSNVRERLANLLTKLSDEFVSEIDTRDFIDGFKRTLNQELETMVREILGVRYDSYGRSRTLELNDSDLSKAIEKLAKKAGKEYLEEFEATVPAMSDEIRQAMYDVYNREYMSTIYQAISDMARSRAEQDAELIITEVLGIKDYPLREKRR